jgi:predicted HD superfamily hydrolase involved in NAD metabolism
MTQENEKRLSIIREALPRFEEPQRIEHTLGVYRECLWMSKVFRLSEEEAYTVCAAALLHDIAKTLPLEKALLLAEKQGKTLKTDVPTVIHQHAGAMLALEEFGRDIVNDEMLSAIECHTTGKAGMTMLDKMLFVADFTEAGRKYRSCQEMREYLHQECEKINKNDKTALSHLLNDITKRIIGFTVTYLIEKNKKIDAGMILAWNAMVSEA